MNVESHPWALVRGVKTFPGRKRGEVAISDGGVLQGNDHRGGGERRKAAHEREDHIPAPKAVVLYDGKRKSDPGGRRRGRGGLDGRH